MDWKGNVVQLRNKDFDSNGNIINQKCKSGKCILLVYATWCGHCRTLHPTYQELANKVFTFMNIAAVEDSDAGKFKDAVEFRGYPSIFLYSNGKLVNSYEGGRDIASLVEFAKDASRD